MHTFRLGQLIVKGGFKVCRLTTKSIEGAIGTLISRGKLVGGKTSPEGLRGLFTGLYISTSYTKKFSRVAPSGSRTLRYLRSPMTNPDKSLESPGTQSNLESPRKCGKKSPRPTGKPPNILILCECETKRLEIKKVLKTVLANDRYAIYDIHWDQLDDGGWSDQTALLVLAGQIPDRKGITYLLEFIRNGGRLFSWCCESPPFGVEKTSINSMQKRVIQYGPAQKVTHPLMISESLWKAVGDHKLPPEIESKLKTSDGCSLPMNALVYGSVKDTNQTCVVQLNGGNFGGKAILSQIHFEKCVGENDSLEVLSSLLSQNLGIDCTQIKAPEYTFGYLLGEQKKITDFLAVNPSTVQQSNLTIEFNSREKRSLPSHQRLPIKIFEHPLNFSSKEYYDNLTTRELGRLVIYTDVITSTNNVIHGHFLAHGLVVIASRQTNGRGRGKNVWLSPEGCACFSLQLSIDLDSILGRHLSLIQHIAGLAVVSSIPNHKELGLGVKWPNDIYINDTKIGGILVESQLHDKKAIVIIGIGLNVSNAYPTISLNSVLQEQCDSNDQSYTNEDKPVFSIERVIAGILSKLETLLQLVENNSIDKIITSYTENWIHCQVGDDSEEVVRVEVSRGNFAECKIIGIDEFGFLRVKDIGSGQVLSVRPDGNSFDIANKLIAIKN